MYKTNKGRHAILLNPAFFCSSHHVWSRLQCVHTSSLPRVSSPWFRYCGQAGRLVALGALEKRGQWLHLFPTEKDYRSWRPWLITQRQTSEYGQGKVQLFNSSRTQSIQTSCWRSFPSSPRSFFSVTTAVYCLSLPICGSHNYLGRGVVVIVGVPGQCSTLHFHWRWVPFSLVRVELIDFVNAFGDQWFLNNKWPLWSPASHIVCCVCAKASVCTCVCYCRCA